MATSTRTRPGSRTRPTRTVRSSQRNASRSNGRSGSPMVWLIVLGGVVLVMLGFMIGTRAGGGDDAKEVATTTSVVSPGFSAATGGPRRYDGLVPVGFEQSARGATAAATAYTESVVQMLNSGATEAQAGLAKMSTPAGLGRVEGGFGNVYDLMRKGLAASAIAAQQPGSTATANGAAFIHYTPVGSRVVSYTNATAIVEIWGLTVVAVDGSTAPTAMWGTDTITLVWDTKAKDWRIDDWTGVEGPTPVWAPTVATPTSDFLTRVTQLSPYRSVPKQ